MKQLLSFLVVGSIAAATNFLSRIVLSQAMPFPAAITLAYLIGMATAFLLNRRFVFREGNERPAIQALWFTLVNVIAMAQTLAVSLLLDRWLLPALDVTNFREEIAHAIGVAIPIFTSYFGHRNLSFRVR